jgi:hypothetical protein
MEKQVYEDRNGQMAFPVSGLDDKAKETYLSVLKREKTEAKYKSELSLEKICKEADFFKKLSEYLKKLNTVADVFTIVANLNTAEEHTRKLLHEIQEAKNHLYSLQVAIEKVDAEKEKEGIIEKDDSDLI